MVLVGVWGRGGAGRGERGEGSLRCAGGGGLTVPSMPWASAAAHSHYLALLRPHGTGSSGNPARSSKCHLLARFAAGPGAGRTQLRGRRTGQHGRQRSCWPAPPCPGLAARPRGSRVRGRRGREWRRRDACAPGSVLQSAITFLGRRPEQDTFPAPPLPAKVGVTAPEAGLRDPGTNAPGPRAHRGGKSRESRGLSLLPLPQADRGRPCRHSGGNSSSSDSSRAGAGTAAKRLSLGRRRVRPLGVTEHRRAGSLLWEGTTEGAQV